MRSYEAVCAAYAKLNLTLNVIGKRPDGYHELESVMQAVSLHDTVTVRLRLEGRDTGNAPDTDGRHFCGAQASKGRSARGASLGERGAGAEPICITVSVDTPDEYISSQLIPQDHSNSAYRAAAEFFRRQARRQGVKPVARRQDVRPVALRQGMKPVARPFHDLYADIHITKRIPASAGLGGGSADAAAVLLALNCIAGLPDGVHGLSKLTQSELSDAALSVGADVPFCLSYGADIVFLVSARDPETTAVESRFDSRACEAPETGSPGGAPESRFGSRACEALETGSPGGARASGPSASPAPRQARTAYAGGVGERLSDIKYPPPAYAAALVNPRVNISTAQIFNIYKSPGAEDIKNRSKLARDMIKSQNGDWSNCFNALEPPAIGVCPEIGRIKAELLGAGAICAVMSGSGPTVFGLFESPETARSAADLARSGGAWAMACELLV